MLEPIRNLLDCADGAPALPPELRRLYGGDLHFPARTDRPYVVGNFVATVDGIVSYNIPGKSGGGEISGHNEPDRFIMGLLRASADAIVIGSGTLHATAPGHLWTAAHIYPEAAPLYERYRADVLGRSAPPLTAVVSASGTVDVDRRAVREGGLSNRIFTTAEGRERLRAAGAKAELVVLDARSRVISPAAMLENLRRECGVRLVLHEGGPASFGEFVKERLVDEFFLTIAPQLAGSDEEHRRPTMISGAAFLPEAAPWLKLLSVKQSGDHLYLRYGSRLKPE